MADEAMKELLESSKAARQSLEETSRRMREHDRRMQEDHERFHRRMERSEQLFIEAIEELNATIVEDGERHRDRLDQLGVQIQEATDSLRAHTRGFLAILDRLGPAPG